MDVNEQDMGTNQDVIVIPDNDHSDNQTSAPSMPASSDKECDNASSKSNALIATIKGRTSVVWEFFEVLPDLD